jgi:transposase
VEVRQNNPVGRICLLEDNFATHKAKRVREKANELDIILIYLPPYSPDLKSNRVSLEKHKENYIHI